VRDTVNSITEHNAAATLGDLAVVRAGYGFRSAIVEAPEGDVTAVQLRDVHRGRVDWSRAARTMLPRPPSGDEWLRPGDILFPFRGTRFVAVALEAVPERAVASTQFMLVRVRDRLAVLPEFLAWQLNQPTTQDYFEQAAQGTAQRSLRRGLIEAVRLTVPTVEAQRTLMQLVNLVRQEREAMEELIRIREQQVTHAAASLLVAQDRAGERHEGD
jgi:hypothetical protein